MSYDKEVREHKKIQEKLVQACNATLEHPPNVIAQNKMVLVAAILEKGLMILDEAERAANLQPNEVESILDRFSQNSNYVLKPAGCLFLPTSDKVRISALHR